MVIGRNKERENTLHWVWEKIRRTGAGMSLVFRIQILSNFNPLTHFFFQLSLFLKFIPLNPKKTIPFAFFYRKNENSFPQNLPSNN
jgi:hypothetical protein